MSLGPIDHAARLQGARDFAHTAGAPWHIDADSLTPASADASFRRYFRVQARAGTYIVMDAPPSHENCQPFVRVAELFSAASMHVPKIFAQDLTAGYLLLEDLGTRTYLPELNAHSAPQLYGAAFDALVRIQLASQPDQLPAYDAKRLGDEMALFPQWYLDKHLGKPLNDTQRSAVQAAFDIILKVNLAEPQVYVHRDFHCRNLMVTHHNSPGVIDFQDAVTGPLSYDLVSLLRDAYIEWPEAQQIDFAIRYWEQARAAGLPVRADFGDFWRDFEFMGLQRHLKVLGIFARLYHRDGKAGYLRDIPRVSRYARTVLERYRMLLPLLKVLDAAENFQRPTGYTF
jgi:N-acetylmuramate 1-kinase